MAFKAWPRRSFARKSITTPTYTPGFTMQHFTAQSLLLDRAYPQSVGYVPASGARYYAVNDPRTLLLSVRYDL
ncbi:hypothetical protein ACTJKT_01640 [Pseudomonas sp. 22526]